MKIELKLVGTFGFGLRQVLKSSVCLMPGVRGDGWSLHIRPLAQHSTARRAEPDLRLR